MRRTLVFVTVLFAVLFCTSVASASPQVDKVVKGLRSSHVYVAPDTPGTNSDTVVTLEQSLRSDDQIVLVMLPPGGETAISVASQIDQATKHKYVIGVSVGSEVRGFSKILPEGVAIDLMGRAKSISSSTVETLTTFADRTHAWQQENPKQVAKPASKKDKGKSPFVVFVLVVVFVILIVFAVSILMQGLADSDRDETDKIKFKSPSDVRKELEEIYKLRDQLSDVEIRHAIEDICRDTEAFFERSEKLRGRNTLQEATQFVGPLSTVHTVLTQYIDIQNNPRYYPHPSESLQDGKEAIQAFAEYVLKSVQRDSADIVMSFKVDTKILNTTRYQ